MQIDEKESFKEKFTSKKKKEYLYKILKKEKKTGF